MQHHKPEYHEEKLVYCLQCQGHRKGLYNQSIISTVSSKVLFGLQPNLVQHHKPERPIEKWDYCVQGQGYSEGSKCQ